MKRLIAILFVVTYTAFALWGVYHSGCPWWKQAALTVLCLAVVVPLLLPDATRERLWKPIGDRLWAPLDRLQDRWIEVERQKPENIEFERRRQQLEQELETEINPLPLEVARRRAEALLADP
jgi:hypothetical protein